MTYAEVLLPLPLTTTFTYSVPDGLAPGCRPGFRVIVPFGRKKFYTAIVVALTHIPPQGYEVKPVAMTLDTSPILRHPQLKFWEWIADYYLCSTGEVYKAALPSGLKIESETFIDINPDFEESPDSRLSERELMILANLKHAERRMTLGDLDRITGFSNVAALVSRLLDKGALSVDEKIVERYRVKRETCVALTANRGDSDSLHAAFNTVKGAPKQEKALMTLLELSRFMRRGEELREVTRAELTERAGVTTAIISVLEKRGIVRLYRREISRFAPVAAPTSPLPELTDAQKTALDEIHKSWFGNDITLLHGVTSSGKTEIYIHLIDYILRQNRQALYLVPEIALTTQLTTRLQRVFGPKVIIYHSKFTDAERVELWRRLLTTNDPLVVIGARSSVFLPFASLGLVIIDEEHEPSYKQQDPAPRYNARDAALVLARMHGAKALLGSATPAIDTYYKASTGRYGLVRLTERFGDAPLPQVEIVDTSLARRKKEMNGTFSFRLRRLVADAVSAGNQAILFLNRRGFAPMALCRQCGYVPKCENCDVSLTYHRHIDKLVCHYCGTPYELPRVCPACKEPAIEVVGYGTERVADEIDMLFPHATIARLDRDTTRDKDGYERIIEQFSNRRSDILVGTQMVTKGLDFGGVSVVGVVNADALVNFPDFRSTERAFNMLEQVAGRAGRRSDCLGRVVVQTSQPSNPVFTHLINHDYSGHYADLLKERRLYNYPPFTRIIYLYLKHRDEARLNTLATGYGMHLRQLFGNRVSGPDAPAVSRVQRMHIRRIMLKVETDASMKKVKQILRNLYVDMHSSDAMRGAIVYYDVDPG